MRLKVLCSILILNLLIGCTTSSSLYTYEKYSQRQYKLHKLQTDEAMVQYEEELANVISVSTQKNKRVPPGIYAEFGYLHAKRGDKETAQEYFDKELALYPEAQAYVGFLKKQLSAQ